MSIKLNVGCNFGNEHTSTIIDLIEFSKEQNNGIILDSVYGSCPSINSFGSARPRRRELEISKSAALLNIRTLRALGIKVNLTLNSVVPNEHSYRKDMFSQTFIDWLDEIHDEIDALIVAHPGVIDFIHENSDIPIIVSTVMNVHSIPQIKFIKKHWPNVIKICPALWRNRDLQWLHDANEILPLELLANEFCTLGGVECEGLYRQACYINHSTDGCNWQPMDVCTEERREHPWSWMQAKFILPQWMSYYQNCVGIDDFKITGRTHPSKFVEYIGKTYLSGRAKGNLLALWGMLEATYNNVNQEDEHKQALEKKYPYISIESIENSHRYNHNTCKAEFCGNECNWCETFYKNNIEKQNGN